MRVFLSVVGLGLVFGLMASGCSGDNAQPDAGSDASDEGDAGFAAPHAPMPQVVSSGGSVIASPKVVAISFQGDPLQSDVDAFASQLVSAPAYWSGAVGEYGVGAINETPYHAQETAPAGTISDTDVQTWLTNKINTDSTFPKPDASTIYTLFYPAGTTVASGLDTTCNQMQGYHSSYPLSSSVNVIYAIVPRCPPPPVAGVTNADQMTAEASHELVEAATDPLPSQTPDYLSVDSDSHAWELLAGGEIGDLCAAFPNSFYKASGFDHLVQRVWSNQAAAANHDPCQPDGTSPYFNSAPLVGDTITVRVGGVPIKTKGVALAVGASTTIEVDLYSDAPTSGKWTVSVVDITSAFFGGAPALTLTLDQTTGQNGDKLNLTIKLLRLVVGGAPFWIQSDLGSATTVWLGAVNPN